MRILPKLTLLFAVFFLAASEIRAQNNKVTDANIEKLLVKAREQLKHISYRSKLSFVNYEDYSISPSMSYVRTTEYLHPERTYSTYEEKRGNGTVSKAEKISIGVNSYVKLNNEAWKVEEVHDAYLPLFSTYLVEGDETSTKCGSINLVEYGRQITQKCESIGFETIGEQSLHLYRVTTTKRKLTKSKSNPSGRFLVDLYVKTFWLDEQGRFIKIETVFTRDHLLKTQELFRALMEYEYNAKDFPAIEAPIK